MAGKITLPISEAEKIWGLACEIDDRGFAEIEALIALSRLLYHATGAEMYVNEIAKATQELDAHVEYCEDLACECGGSASADTTESHNFKLIVGDGEASHEKREPLNLTLVSN